MYDVNVNTVSGLNSATIVTQDDWFGWHLAILVSEIDEVKVGGNLLSIDSTALLLAGLQSSAIWMVPVMVGVAGVGIYLVRSRI